MLVKFIATTFMAVLLSACVTNITGKALPTADKAKSIVSHVQLGMDYLRNRNLDLARNHFDKALRLDPTASGALNGRAVMYQLEGELDLAEENFLAALASEPESSQSRNNYGRLLYRQKRFEEAYEAFERVSRDLQYSARAGAMLNLGRAAKKVDNIDRAEAVFKQAVALEPSLTQAFVELADIKFNQKEYAESKHYLDRFTQSSKQTARSLWLGIRIEAIFGNKDKIASNVMALKNIFPYSKEYLEYQNSVKP